MPRSGSASTARRAVFFLERVSLVIIRPHQRLTDQRPLLTEANERIQERSIIGCLAFSDCRLPPLRPDRSASSPCRRRPLSFACPHPCSEDRLDGRSRAVSPSSALLAARTPSSQAGHVLSPMPGVPSNMDATQRETAQAQVGPRGRGRRGPRRMRAIQAADEERGAHHAFISRDQPDLDQLRAVVAGETRQEHRGVHRGPLDRWRCVQRKLYASLRIAVPTNCLARDPSRRGRLHCRPG